MFGGTKVHRGYEAEGRFKSHPHSSPDLKKKNKTESYLFDLENLLGNKSSNKKSENIFTENSNGNLLDCFNNSSNDSFLFDKNSSEKAFDLNSLLRDVHLDHENNEKDSSSDKENELHKSSVADLRCKTETSKPAFDLSSLLRDVHLDHENKEKGNSSNKENTLHNLSVADIFYKTETSKPAFDLSSLLRDVHLDHEKDNSSDKEDELHCLSVADLFYKTETSKTGNSSIKDITNEFFDKSNDSLTLLSINEDNTRLHSSSPDQSLISLLDDLTCDAKSEQGHIQPIEHQDFEVNLDLARKNSFASSDPFHPCVQNNFDDSFLYPKINFDSVEVPTTKGSLFCKVLCSKVRKPKVQRAPKFPKSLSDLLFQHISGHKDSFAFDTPSPDDIVKEKHRHAFKNK